MVEYDDNHNEQDRRTEEPAPPRRRRRATFQPMPLSDADAPQPIAVDRSRDGTRVPGGGEPPAAAEVLPPPPVPTEHPPPMRSVRSTTPTSRASAT